METKTAWSGFAGRKWKEDVDVRDFIQKNYEPYDGDECFLANPTEATKKLWGELQKLQKKEREQGGVLDMETEVVSGLTAYPAGYINEDMRWMEFPTRRRLTRAHLDMMRKSARTIWYACWTATLIRAHII